MSGPRRSGIPTWAGEEAKLFVVGAAIGQNLSSSKEFEHDID